MKRLAGLLVALLVVTMPALAAEPTADSEPSDLVSAISIQAPVSPGPAWWRISNGRSTVWVMGIPEIFSDSLRWNSTVLRQRIARAQRVIYPTDLYRWPGTPTGSLGRHALDYLGQSAPPPIAQKTLSERLDPALAARLERQISAISSRTVRARLRTLDTYNIALWLERLTWPDSAFVNPAIDLAVSETPASARDPLGGFGPTVRSPEPELVNRIVFSSLPPPESVQQRCLADILTLLEDPQTVRTRRAAMEAWAKGDLEKGLKRWPYVQYCLWGTQAGRRVENWWENKVQIFKYHFEVAFSSDKPTEFVGLVPFDALFGSTGLLKYYSDLGYSVRRA
ncbi:MAG: hypothetical protein JWM33_2309 [Caulobacteraceae bacterium]|nr:hypothetical protein [Caulobacteraceae bacterium]